MSSGNAFRDTLPDKTSVLSKALKRAKESVPVRLQKLGQDAGTPEQAPPPVREAAIWQRTAHEDTVLEVDILILDYLAHQTTNAALKERLPGLHGVANGTSLEHNIAMTDAFVQMFRAKHPSHDPDAELQFRLLLLKFTTLYTQRLTHNSTTLSKVTLQALREQNQSRARDWIGSADRIPSSAYDMSHFDTQLPIPQVDQEQSRAYVLRMLDTTEEDNRYEDAFYGTSGSLSLLDLLPVFMKVVALRNAIGSSNINKTLMQMVGEYMRQACVEQYLVHGDSGSDAIDEAFAWGLQPSNEAGEAMEMDGEAEPHGQDRIRRSRSSEDINAMFTGDDADTPTEVLGWAETKTRFIEELILPVENLPGLGLKEQFEALAHRHPIAAFDAKFRSFLTALLASTSGPILLQLDNGCLDGYSEDQTRKFLRGCGLNN